VWPESIKVRKQKNEIRVPSFVNWRKVRQGRFIYFVVQTKEQTQDLSRPFRQDGFMPNPFQLKENQSITPPLGEPHSKTEKGTFNLVWSKERLGVA